MYLDVPTRNYPKHAFPSVSNLTFNLTLPSVPLGTLLADLPRNLAHFSTV